MGKPPSGGPRRRRGGPQVAVLASRSSSKAQAHAQQHDALAADVAGQWAGPGGAGEAGRKSPSWRAAASAARLQPAPPRCRSIKRNTCQCTGWTRGATGRTDASTGGVVRRSCPPDAGRCPVPCATTRSTDRGARMCKPRQPSQTSAGGKWGVDDI